VKVFRALVPVAGGLVLAGCTLFTYDMSLLVRLPDPPRHWQESFASYAWQLRFPAPGGGLAEHILAGEQKEALLRVPKQRNLPVSGVMVLSSGLRLPAAGGVYPLDSDAEPAAGQLDLYWRHGMLAELFLKLIAGGVDVSGMNSRRLAEETWARSAGDPWRLDLNAMAEALAAEDFTVYDIRLLPAGSVTVCPGEGTWFLESPFAIPREADGEGNLELEHLPAGRHVLFAQGGESRYLLSLWEASEPLLVPQDP
jgi:hypothetical protein